MQINHLSFELLESRNLFAIEGSSLDSEGHDSNPDSSSVVEASELSVESDSPSPPDPNINTSIAVGDVAMTTAFFATMLSGLSCSSCMCHALVSCTNQSHGAAAFSVVFSLITGGLAVASLVELFPFWGASMNSVFNSLTWFLTGSCFLGGCCSILSYVKVKHNSLEYDSLPY